MIRRHRYADLIEEEFNSYLCRRNGFVPSPPVLRGGMSTRVSPLNEHLLTICAVASLGGLLFGFDTAVISGATRMLTAMFELSPLLLV